MAGPSEDQQSSLPWRRIRGDPLLEMDPAISLFAVTIFTTLWAGAYQAYNGPIRGPVNLLLEQPETLWHGIPFAATLLTILVTHECGHYVLSRIHGVPASLPLFIPGPPYFVGTFGAIIRLRGPIMNRRALFDIGVAGPLAGFIAAVVALVIGLNLSTVVDRTGTMDCSWANRCSCNSLPGWSSDPSLLRLTLSCTLWDSLPGSACL